LAAETDVKKQKTKKKLDSALIRLPSTVGFFPFRGQANLENYFFPPQHIFCHDSDPNPFPLGSNELASCHD